MLEKALHTIRFTKKNDPSPFIGAWKTHPSGYPRFSERIAVRPETGIYRRFDALNARRILYLQAELCIMEKQLRRLEERDSKDESGKKSNYATDYQSMLQTPLNEYRQQLELVGRMQSKLEQYSKYCHSLHVR
jgi:signal transduction histidine kinase